MMLADFFLWKERECLKRPHSNLFPQMVTVFLAHRPTRHSCLTEQLEGREGMIRLGGRVTVSLVSHADV